MKWFFVLPSGFESHLLNNTIMTEPQLIFVRSRSSEHDSDSEFPCTLKRHFAFIRGKSLAITSHKSGQVKVKLTNKMNHFMLPKVFRCLAFKKFVCQKSLFVTPTPTSSTTYSKQPYTTWSH